MKKINDTKSISDLLNSSLFGENLSKEKMNTIIKHSTIFSFWEQISGRKFAAFSKPYAIKASKLYISAKSPVIIQELTLYKKKLLEKINSYSMPLGIEIKDIVFNYKNYNNVANTEKKEEFVEDKPLWLDESDLNIPDNDEEKSISKNIEKITFLSDEQKASLIKKVINTNKAKRLRESKK